MSDEPELISLSGGEDEYPEYIQDGVYVDPDQHPVASEGYNASRFGDPEWYGRTHAAENLRATDMTGHEIDINEDPTEGLLEVIDRLEERRKNSA